jgi:mono/diheme cytochrome c family protein
MQTGRPNINEAARYRANEPVMVYPTAMGGHNWQPMSYSPKTGLIYLPILEMGAFYNGQSNDEFEFKERHWNVGYHIEGSPMGTGLTNALLKTYPKSYLLAWDPSTQQEAWRKPHRYLHAGGTLATGGDLVFQGSADHWLRAYAASDGRELWAKELFTGISAAPISYRIDGEQYIAVAAGRGGALSMAMGIEHDKAAGSAKIYSFKLNGAGQWPKPPAPKVTPAPPPRLSDVTDEQRAEGQRLFNSYCGRCHGMNVVGDSSVPELRRLDPIWHQHFNKVVLEGMMESAGMPRFDDVLDEQSARWVQAYIIERAHQDAERRSRPQWQQTVVGWYEQAVAYVLSWLM